MVKEQTENVFGQGKQRERQANSSKNQPTTQQATADIASDALTKQLQQEAHCRHRAILLGEQRTAWPEPNEQAATATIIDYTADSDTANPIYQYEL